jgi:hypothetical protein
MNIPLGFEIPDAARGIAGGRRVDIPLGHTIVLGQTQLSGKTTTLQAMTERSGVCAIAFITKRGEKSFRGAREIPPYFTETSVMQPYWKFVISMVEGVMDSKLGSRERGWVMNLCRDYELSKNTTDTKGKKKRSSTEWEEPATLRAVLENAKKALAFTRSVNELICVQLVEYLKMAVPEIESAKLSATIKLHPGINVMDLSKLSHNVQGLVLRSVVEWVYTSQRRTVVIIPEAWKFLPEGRTTPVSFPVEELIRQGAALQNFVWIDLQDLRGIKKLLLRSIQVWLFGVQREKNEVANTLKSMPTPEHKPSASEMMQLGIGEFIAAYGNELRRVYVWPAGMEETHAQAIALGHEDAKSWKRIARALDEQEKETEAEPAGGAGDDAPQSGLPGDEPLRASRGVPGGYADGDSLQVYDREETMWKEKYEALKEEFDQLREAHDALAKRLELWTRPISDPESAGETVLAAANSAKQHPASNGTHDLDNVYRYVVERASKDPGILRLIQQQPELQVTIKREILEVDGKTLQGGIAILIKKGFFERPTTATSTVKELRRLGYSFKDSTITTRCNELVTAGFLTREESGFLAVPNMKINIVEAK